MSREERAEQSKYMLELTDTVTGELFNIICAQQAAYGYEFSRDFMFSLGRSFLASIVLTSLTITFPEKMSEAERFMLKRKSYAETKLRLEATIGEAFDLAFAQYNPKTSPTHLASVRMIDSGEDAISRN